jgi:probable rRNA maturation factor
MRVLIMNQQRKVRINQRKIKTILTRIGRLLDLNNSEISILFVNDRMSRELNSHFRGINRPTDVLSFPMENPVKDPEMTGKGIPFLLGDIVINLHRTVDQAKESGNSFYDELTFLLVHGVLHLLGYDHEKNNYQAARMRKKEKEILDALKEMD